MKRNCMVGPVQGRPSRCSSVSGADTRCRAGSTAHVTRWASQVGGAHRRFEDAEGPGMQEQQPIANRPEIQFQSRELLQVWSDHVAP